MFATLQCCVKSTQILWCVFVSTRKEESDVQKQKQHKQNNNKIITNNLEERGHELYRDDSVVEYVKQSVKLRKASVEQIKGKLEYKLYNFLGYSLFLLH